MKILSAILVFLSILGFSVKSGFLSLRPLHKAIDYGFYLSGFSIDTELYERVSPKKVNGYTALINYLRAKSRVPRLAIRVHGAQKNLYHHELKRLRKKGGYSYMMNYQKARMQADVHYGDEEFAAEMTFKGSRSDHYDTKKTSLKITSAKRSFILRHPKVRNFQYESLVASYLRKKGLQAPEHNIVRVFLNDNDLGLMELEESYEQKTLAKEQGVFLRLEKSFLANKRGRHYFKGFWNNRDLHLTSASSKKAKVLETYARSVFRMLQRGRLQPSEVFAVDRVVDFIVYLEVLNATHALENMDLRFFLDAETLKISLALYDASVGSDTSEPILMHEKKSLVRYLLSDPVFAAAYKAKVNSLNAQDLLPEIKSHIDMHESAYLANLHKEFPHLPRVLFKPIEKKLKRLKEQPFRQEPLLQNFFNEEFKEQYLAGKKRPEKIFRASLIKSTKGRFVEVENFFFDKIRLQVLKLDGHTNALTRAITIERSALPTQIGVFEWQVESQIDVNKVYIQASTDTLPQGTFSGSIEGTFYRFLPADFCRVDTLGENELFRLLHTHGMGIKACQKAS